MKFQLNGKAQELENPNPLRRLLDVLREDLGLTGTKEGCGEGECGSCTVLFDGRPVCSCLVPIFQVEGAVIRTVEAIQSESGDLDPLQAAFVDAGGVQCGACTPGFVVSARALLDAEPTPTRERIAEALAGNICRCTGYERIFQAVEQAAGVKSGAAARSEEPAEAGASKPKKRLSFFGRDKKREKDS